MRATLFQSHRRISRRLSQRVANASFVFGPITTFGANSFQPVLASDGVDLGDAHSRQQSNV